MRIINITQHASTPEQRAAGVEDLQDAELEFIKKALTFVELPSQDELDVRALALSSAAATKLSEEVSRGEKCAAMIGGAPYLMARLEIALKSEGITPVYAFSKRVSVETRQQDGTVVKTAQFKHEGFVEA